MLDKVVLNLFQSCDSTSEAFWLTMVVPLLSNALNTTVFCESLVPFVNEKMNL